MLEYLSNNVAGLKAGNLLKRDPTQVFSSEYCEIFENIFFIEHLRWLFLSV